MSEEIYYIGNDVYISYGLRGFEVWFKDNDGKYTFSYNQGYEPYGPPDPEDDYDAMIRKLERWASNSYKSDPRREDAKRILYAIEHQDEYEQTAMEEEEEEDDKPISIELITN